MEDVSRTNEPISDFVYLYLNILSCWIGQQHFYKTVQRVKN